MSWVTHDVEPYVIRRHLHGHVSFVAILLGSWGPDLLSKWFVYGVQVGDVELRAPDPAQFHRGWPGVGFTHSLAFGVVIAALIVLLTGSRVWGLSFGLGQWAHALTDTGDTLGTMLFFPFSTETVSVGAWVYAGEAGRYLDAAAYFSGLGFVWDGVWLVYGLLCWRVLTRSYFREIVVPADGFWRWSGRFLPEEALLAIYRGAFFYGSARWVAWLIWAHVVNRYSFDLRWGGPYWIDGVR